MDLKIVGAGSLGVRVALLWKSKYPDAKIYLKTRSNKPGRSTLWREAGFIPVSADDDTSTANYVVFRYWPLFLLMISPFAGTKDTVVGKSISNTFCLLR